MMKNGTRVALSVRKEDGSIEVKTSEFHPAKEKHKWLNIPIIRGIVGFVESLILSFKTMSVATDMLGLDDEPATEPVEAAEPAEAEEVSATSEEKKEVAESVEVKEEASATNEEAAESVEAKEEASTTNEEAAEPVKARDEEPKKEEKKKSGGSTAFAMIISVVLGLALAIGLFIVLPTMVTGWIDIPVKAYIDQNGMNQYLKAAIEGVLKVIIFIVYIAVVGQMKDIKRTFAYHGAEHKSIACYEAGLELTPENARKCSRFHPRCGTSFMFVMILLGIIIGMFIPEFEEMPWLRILCKIATLPIVMGLGYEFIMLAGKHQNWFTKALSAPGLWMQRLTTKEPDDNMLAVAICSLKASMPEEFPDFDPNEYKITREENTGHIMIDEKANEKK